MKKVFCFGILLALCAENLTARAEENGMSVEQLPYRIVKPILAKFPGAKLTEASQEDADGEITYEVSIDSKGRHLDVTVNSSGEIERYEAEIALDDLPKEVKKAIKDKHSKAKLKQAEGIYEIEEDEDSEDELEFYEVALQREDGSTFEVKLDPDGSEAEDEADEDEADDADTFTSDFSSEKPHLKATGSNAYFSLEPGTQSRFAGGDETLVITVLDETKKIDGVETRVVEERETKDGKLVEVSRNFFAISSVSGNVYYFGEEVDDYKDGKVVGHGGSWLAGQGGAKFGLAMPAIPLLGARFQIETAPKVAMDRAEIISLSRAASVPAGDYDQCLAIKETNPLEPGAEETKLYARGVGLLIDGAMKLVSQGKAKAD
ncbi:MAG: hypothetical protein ACTHOU_20950 [Aureliella sp.]